MRATVRRFHSPDADLATFVPSDPRDVAVLIQIMAGPADGPGEESFDGVVCTPHWLDRWVQENGPTVGRHYLVVAEYDEPRTRVFLTEEVESLEAETWPELAAKIGRVGMWEFEDYRT